MKLAAKITLSMVALLGVLFAVGGAVMIQRNFTRSLDEAAEQGFEIHVRQKEMLRGHMAETFYSQGYVETYTAYEAGGLIAASQDGKLAILQQGYTAVYNDLPTDFTKSVQAEALAMEPPGYAYYRFGDARYLVVPSTIGAAGGQLGLISVFDVTSVFAERQAQTYTFYTVYAAILAVTVLAVYLVVRRATKPLQKLSDVSGEIAAGNYARRTEIHREDEIGDLARHFDEMAAAVEEKVASLELSVQQREDFMGAFTHELKTPMTAMMGYASLLKDDVVNEEKKERALQYIHTETKRLEDLSQKMLMLLGLAEEEVELRPVALRDIFAKVQEALQSIDDCEVVFACEDDLYIEADADLMADLVINLVQNGIHAKPMDAMVRVTAEQAGDTYTLTVADRGAGIPPEKLARIQEPFYRVDKARTRTHSGSGLGLAICARIAALHGTRLDITSQPQEGTMVRVVLKPATSGKEAEQ